MSPDDERHGTRRGYYAHGRDGEAACAPCKRAAAGAEARYQMNRNAGITCRVDPLGTRRRLQALCAIGWTFRSIDEQIGSKNLAGKWVNEERRYVFTGTAVKIAALYDRLCMSFPPERTKEERINAIRARNLARRNGWPPPLAWDNIDDPNEQPHGWQHKGTSRADQLRDLNENMAGITEVCQYLNITRKALEKWCERHDLTPLYSRLVAREQPRYWANQHAEGVA